MSLTEKLQSRGLSAAVKEPGGPKNHHALLGREEPDQHPMDAITGLSAALGDKLEKAHGDNLDNPHGVTAAQVGARPDTWLPTAAQVGARPADWLPTAAQVGARPNDWLPTPADIAAAPAAESDQYPGCYYRMVDGITEWLNPPLVSGVEYATTRRWNGRRVYAMLVDVGTMPDSSAKTVTVTSELVTVVSLAGTATAAKECDAFPVVFSGSIAAYAYTFPSEGTGTRVTVKTLANLSTYTARFIVQYVKE